MARFEEAENRMFNVKICLKCNARNPAAAKRIDSFSFTFFYYFFKTINLIYYFL